MEIVLRIEIAFACLEWSYEPGTAFGVATDEDPGERLVCCPCLENTLATQFPLNLHIHMRR